METAHLPSETEMYRAFAARDGSYDGIFFTGVRSTGIFCRPSCPARKPQRRNLEFFRSPAEAASHGYRPCKRCRPLEPSGDMPSGIRDLLRDLMEQAGPDNRLRDADLRRRGLEPAAVRRWFKRHYGMTFHDYQRSLRLGHALEQLACGDTVTNAAFDSGYESLSGFNAAIAKLTGRSAGANRSATLVYLNRILTPLGPMLAGTTDRAVCMLEFMDRRMLERQLKSLSGKLGCVFVPGRPGVATRLSDELRDYFDGRLTEFTVPLEASGTPFQKKAWEALRRIPYGETRSYAEQARMIGAPAAVRAVARANGENRIAVLVPCHRVIGSDGTLTGYGGGLWRKRYLLDLEMQSRQQRDAV